MTRKEALAHKFINTVERLEGRGGAAGVNPFAYLIVISLLVAALMAC